MPYFLVSKYINEERVLGDIWTVLASVDSYWSKVHWWFFVLNQSFELLFAFVAQRDNWVSRLTDGSSKCFSCFKEWLLTISPGSAAKSNSMDTGFSQQLLLFGLGSSDAELLLPLLCQHRLEIALQRCQSDFAGQFLLLFSPCSVMGPGAVYTV